MLMTENEIKEMLKDIIINGAEYEYTYKDANGDYKPWMKYKLGNEINPFHEYRKVEKWYVSLVDGRCDKFTIDKDKTKLDIVFEGSKEACEVWVNEHSKTWLNERKSCLSVSFGKKEINLYEAGAKEICKKILEVLKDELYLPTYEGVFNLTKDLGVEV